MAIGSIFRLEQKLAPSHLKYGGPLFYAIADLFTQSPTCLWQALRSKVEDQKQGTSTMDIVVLGIGILFFALSFAYIKACDIL